MGRRLGQHFLVRQSILDSIARAACPDLPDTVLEIGPGRGALTAHLLPLAKRVVAVEIDQVLVQYLRAKFRADPRLEILEDDILKSDLSRWSPSVVVGNLPYYITSPIIHRVLSLRQLARAVFLVQKEVAARLIAAPGTRDYGYLSVQTQLLAEVEQLFTVSASAFRPPPKVESAVVRLIPRPDIPVEDPGAFLKFAARAFHQKRKTLRNNLTGAYDQSRVDALPEARLRAEQLPIPDLISIWQRLAAPPAAGRDSL